MKLLGLSILALFLVSCSPKNEELVINVLPPIVAPVVDPLSVKNVDIKAYNANELIELAEQNKDNPEFVLFGMDLDNFKNLVGNLVDIGGYIENQRQVINFLEDAANVGREKEVK